LSFLERLAAVVAAAALVLSTAVSAAAQQARPDRPFRGLFGEGEVKERGQSLSLDWSLYGARDGNVTAETTADPRLVLGGKYGAASGARPA
jgi:hypothetical protein